MQLDFMRGMILGVLTAGALIYIATRPAAPSEAPGAAGSSTPPVAVTSPFIYSFNVPGTLQESGSMDASASPYWWLDSGGYFIVGNNTGETVQGALPAADPWRIAYAGSNPTDTDQGAHPQNIFRLVTRSTWDNVREQMGFYIAADNLSSSPNRNESNGLLLMSRYTGDGQTLYYAGIRVDGTAVIKKKYHGTYYTMAQKPVFSGAYTGTGAGANLLPHGEWIALRSDTRTNADGSVTVTLSMQLQGGDWVELLSANDTGKNFGDTPPILGPGYMGIRTDFMDVRFEGFSLENL
jgi:hypothetical protein